MIVGIVGLGLIGGSIAKSLRGKGYEIYGQDSDNEVFTAAINAGDILGSLDNTHLKSIDILIFALYPRKTVELMGDYMSHLKDGCIVTDVGGVKSSVVDKMHELSRQYPNIKFIGGHPMAGRETSGYLSASADLFRGATYLYTWLDSSDDYTQAVMVRLINDIGCAKAILTTPNEHDRAIAFSSQLPHIVSNSYIKSDSRKFCPDFSGGSFNDFIRVAGLNAEMWTGLMMDNRVNILAELQGLIDNLNDCATAIRDKDEAKLMEIFRQGNKCKGEIKG